MLSSCVRSKHHTKTHIPTDTQQLHKYVHVLLHYYYITTTTATATAADTAAATAAFGLL